MMHHKDVELSCNGIMRLKAQLAESQERVRMLEEAREAAIRLLYGSTRKPLEVINDVYWILFDAAPKETEHGS